LNKNQKRMVSVGNVAKYLVEWMKGKSKFQHPRSSVQRTLQRFPDLRYLAALYLLHFLSIGAVDCGQYLLHAFALIWCWQLFEGASDVQSRMCNADVGF
jgi:hypothetical protein